MKGAHEADQVGRGDPSPGGDGFLDRIFARNRDATGAASGSRDGLEKKKIKKKDNGGDPEF